MTEARPHAANPFPGLRPYNRDQALFGRDRDLVLFRDRLYSARTTLMFAASGVGKSSFLQAKVVPELEGDHLVVAHARWGARPPLDGLRESWLAALTTRLLADQEVRERLLPLGATTPDAVRAALEALWPKDGAPLEFARRFAELDTVLLLDQFEEPLNSLVRDPAVDALVDALAALINEPKLPLRVVLSMRQEFLAELSLFENRIPDLFSNYLNLRHPTQVQAASIISLSVESAGAKANSAGVDALAQDLLLIGGLQGDTTTSTARPLRFVVPPVLQIVCSRMWSRYADKLTADTRGFAAGYRAGYARKAVQSFVNRLIARLERAQQVLLRKALDFLVSRQGGKIAYESTALAQHLGCTSEELGAALDLLATEPERVFRRIPRTDASIVYELYHDAYAGALNAWKGRFDAELEREAQENARNAAKEAQENALAAAKKSRKQTAWGCAGVAVLGLVLGTCSMAWQSREHRAALTNAGDDYAAARKAYDAVEGNFVKTLFGWFDADEELAKFWDRRTQSAALLGTREHALIYALEALATKDNIARRRCIGEIIGDDLSEIAGTTHTPEPIVALSANGERFATLGRGVVQLHNSKSPPTEQLVAGFRGESLEAPRVKFTDVLLSADGTIVWALGERTLEGKGSSYEQSASREAELEFGLWTRRIDSNDEPRVWVGTQFAREAPVAFSVSADGGAAVGAWLTGGTRRERPLDVSALLLRITVFDANGRRDVGFVPQPSAAQLDRMGRAKTGAWHVALRDDGSAVAINGVGGSIDEVRADNSGTFHVLKHYGSKAVLLRYSPDGRSLAVATESDGLHLLDLGGTSPTSRTLSPDAHVLDLMFDAHSERLYVRTEAGLEAWSTRSGEREGVGHGSFGELVTTAGEERGVIALRNASSGSFLERYSDSLGRPRWTSRNLRSDDSTVSLVAVRVAGRECVAVAGEHTMMRITVPDEELARDSLTWSGARAVLSPDGSRAIVCDAERYALVDVQSGQALSGPHELAQSSLGLSFDIDARSERAFAVMDNSVRELTSNSEFALQVTGHVGQTVAVNDGKQLLIHVSTESGKQLMQLVSSADGALEASFAQSDSAHRFVAAIDPTRRFVATYDVGSGDLMTVWNVESVGQVGQPFAAAESLFACALDVGANRIAIAEAVNNFGFEGPRSSIRVLNLKDRTDLFPDPVGLHDRVLSLAFARDGRAVVVRTHTALLRIPLDTPEPTPSVRYLKRSSIVHEDVPNWFDADDPSGERPRVLVLDAGGRLVLERVRFDGTDDDAVERTLFDGIDDDAVVKRAADDLKQFWSERLDLAIDGDGRVAVPSLFERSSW